MIWRELTEEGVAVSTRTAIAELMLSGTTTTSDHLYLFRSIPKGSLVDDARMQNAIQSLRRRTWSERKYPFS